MNEKLYSGDNLNTKILLKIIRPHLSHNQEIVIKK